MYQKILTDQKSRYLMKDIFDERKRKKERVFIIFLIFLNKQERNKRKVSVELLVLFNKEKIFNV